MIVTRELMVKGAIGFTAALTITAGGIIFRENIYALFVGKREREMARINQTLKNLNLVGDCYLRIDKYEGDQIKPWECELTLENLKKVKFTNKKNKEDLTIRGWGSEEKIGLKLEKKGEGEIKYTFKDIKTKLTIAGDPGKGAIRLEANLEKEFEYKEGALGKVTTLDSQKIEKLKEYNGKLNVLNLPNICRFDEGENDSSIECDIDKEELKRIRFWNRGEGELTYSKGETFSGMKLEVKEESDDLKFIFRGFNNEIELSKGNDVQVLKNNVDNEFVLGDGVLRKKRIVEEIAKLVGLECKYEGLGNKGECKATNEGVKVIFSNNQVETIHLNVREKDSNKFEFYEHEDSYNKKIRFIFKGETKGELTKDSSYEVKEHGGSTYLSKKS